MSDTLLLGLVPNASSAEAAVNDFVEAGVSERRISLIMKDTATAEAIAGQSGPLRGISASALPDKLTGLGVSQSDAQALSAGVQSGQALIALPVDGGSQSDAIQVLQSANGQHIITVPAR